MIKKVTIVGALMFGFAAFADLSLAGQNECQRSKENFFCKGDSVFAPYLPKVGFYRDVFICELGFGQRPLGLGFKNLDGVLTCENDRKIFFPEVTNDIKKAIFHPESLYLKTGCVEGICVGDQIIAAPSALSRVDSFSVWQPSTFYSQKIVLGVNPFKKMVFFGRQPRNYDEGGELEVSRVYVTQGCSRGFCVGDIVQASSYYSTGRPHKATISGINRRSGKFALKIQWLDGYRIQAPAEELILLQMNTNYSPEVRRNPWVYPAIDPRQYIEKGFSFSYSSPLR